MTDEPAKEPDAERLLENPWDPETLAAKRKKAGKPKARIKGAGKPAEEDPEFRFKFGKAW
ncbi:hypothetical protein [Amycolatopsis regifaucium]|uniref:Uncharacterized protein n=1 Tax=Amycolatopsis regifaucium TaxID=546365 RepID=A0A154M4G0_9PSEU|nr:hypothetical protein [Amycolatopsis regifaucium]KZB79393.1 hypothetical protein AVL48_17570 [Amycolatopsis regifaucium]OKA07575.1 hypothetical protein ATP06_0217255 [Amycolatopsis regifaucium]SFH07973.1 hypothetical protein SAMN04489731_102362 [Amycolatopsis regifaucium]